MLDISPKFSTTSSWLAHIKHIVISKRREKLIKELLDWLLTKGRGLISEIAGNLGEMCHCKLCNCQVTEFWISCAHTLDFSKGGFKRKRKNKQTACSKRAAVQTEKNYPSEDLKRLSGECSGEFWWKTHTHPQKPKHTKYRGKYTLKINTKEWCVMCEICAWESNEENGLGLVKKCWEEKLFMMSWWILKRNQGLPGIGPGTIIIASVALSWRAVVTLYREDK